MTSFSWFTDCDYYNSCKQTNKHILFGAVHKLRGQLGAEGGWGQGFCKISTPCPQGGEGRCSNLSSKLMVVEKIRTHHYHPQICHHEQCFRYVNYCRKKIKTFWKPKGMSSFIETNLMTTNFLGVIGVFTGIQMSTFRPTVIVEEGCKVRNYINKPIDQ